MTPRAVFNDIFDVEHWHAMRARDVTASVAGALLGIHPYRSYWSLWMEKAGRMPPEFVSSEPVINADGDEVTLPPAARGHAREREALDLVQLLRPAWEIVRPGKYITDDGVRIGATPDAIVTCPERGRGVIQVKTVAPETFKREWIDPDTREVVPPMWIVVQALVEAKLTGSAWAAVAAHRELYGARPSVKLVEIPLHEPLWSRIVNETAAFWRSIDEGREPDPDFRRDARALAGLYQGDAPPMTPQGEVAERMVRLADERALFKAREADGAAAARDRRPLDAELLTLLGNASGAHLPDGRVIAAKIIKRGAYEVAATQYPQLTIRG